MADLQTALYHSRMRRKSLQRERKFEDLFATPHNLGTQAALVAATTPFVMPQAAWLGVSLNAVVTAGNIEIAVGSRTIRTSALSANQIARIGYFERGFTITPTVNIAGTLTLHYFNQWFKGTAIATGIWT